MGDWLEHGRRRPHDSRAAGARRDGVTETDFGTREFAILDPDGNLLEFFRWVR